MYALRNAWRMNAERNVLYKTKLCRNYERQGSCILGEFCQFAHGINELRQPQDHPRYRTRECRMFARMGYCAFGDQCHFIHI
uniref:C3H1-type domain-containing protein n=1 Tax=Mesocestoides corti TaxID=53468 RepID=A0A5K3FK24_MESCO